MNVVNSGSNFQIYGEDVKTYQHLPVGSYDVCFHQMMGFYLTNRPNLKVAEKVYGNHIEKARKVMSSYELAQRNFGILLSGQKGIGKSIFARILATLAMEHNMPVIVVSTYTPGIANFISSIEQECIVIFDEFEKTFAKNDDCDPQTEMLSLFDGLDGGKKMFVVTCNNTSKLSNYMLNRPGRFHYHIKLTNPSDNEIVEYMYDNLRQEYWDTIESIVSFSHSINITYDFLRAIAFELNQGYSLKETLHDLNISDAENMEFDATLVFDNGMKFYAYGIHMDLSYREQCGAWMQGNFSDGDKYYSRRYYVSWCPAHIKVINGRLALESKEICMDLEFDVDVDEDNNAWPNSVKKPRPFILYFDKVQTYSGSRFIDV